MQDLEMALTQLSAEHREIIHLVCVEELKYEEVAEILNIAVGTVMSRLYRAREQLRALMYGDNKGDSSPGLRRVK
jgi:RNA polymerase sigma-70 factor (ECF subfamily)